MARWELWGRKVNAGAAVKLWEGDAVAGYGSAIGVVLRTCADAVLRDTTATDPALAVRILFTRHGPGDYREG